MRRSAVALIDGEHYPSVVVAAIREAGDRFDFRAALFLGGTEKIKSGDLEIQAAGIYGLPVLFARDAVDGLRHVIDEYRPEVVVDLSDEPVLGYEQRFRLISESLARGVGYQGSDFHFSPATSDRFCTSPSLSIFGTGKRVGKTAVSGYVARVLQEVVTGRHGGPAVVVVAMGRGGPAEPEIVEGERVRLTVADLLARSRQGSHAASDYFEDALLSRVTTVGCRRCGGGMAGEPFFSNVREGVELANGLRPGFVILEGSGAALPPVGSDAGLLVAGAHQPLEDIVGHLGTYRVLMSDAVVLTMAEEPLATAAKVCDILRRLEEVRPGAPVVPVVLRPRPTEDVTGRKVAYFSTAPKEQEPVIRRFLEERWGCRVALLSTNLADRAALRADMARSEMAGVEMVLTEIKAASIDIVAEGAETKGLPVVPVDNLLLEVPPAGPGRLAEVARELAETAKERFGNRA